MIKLPYGGPGAKFDEQELVEHLKAQFRDYIIQGQQNCSLLNHKKPNSLDYWLRTNFAKEPYPPYLSYRITFYRDNSA